MLLFQTFMITLITLLARCHTLFGTSLVNRPIVLGALTGLIMGDLTQGVIMGATLELAFVGAVSIGAYIPPDMVSGTILGTAFAIQAGAGSETALALSYPIAAAYQAVSSIGTPIGLALMHRCDKFAAQGDVKRFERGYWLTGFVSKIIFLPIVPLAFYFGSDVVVSFLDSLPDFIVTGITISGGLIPALGFAMLAQMIMNKKVVAFFFLGFYLVQYFGINTTAVAIFAVIIAIVLVQIEQKMSKNDGTSGGELDEF